MEKKKEKKESVLDDIVGLIDRYEKGETSDDEREALAKWQIDTGTGDTFNRDVLDDLNREIWHRLSRKYHFKKDERQVFRFRVLNHLGHYAAALAVLFILGCGVWGIYSNLIVKDGIALPADAWRLWTTDNRHQIRLTLADGTRVRLNAGSSLKIVEASFNKDKREIWLTGEAFFEVAKNPEKPFIIYTGAMRTIVRGTSFNVKAYEEVGEEVVSVRDGRVEVVKNGRTLGVLTAGRQLVYSPADNKVEISDAYWQDAAGWMEGKFILNGVGVEELKLRFRQYFCVEVFVEQGVLDGKYLQGSFGKDCTLEEVMTAISEIYKIHYMIDKNRITITP